MKYDGPIFRRDKDIESCYVNVYYHRNTNVLVCGKPISTRDQAVVTSMQIANSVMHGMKPTFYRIKIKIKD